MDRASAAFGRMVRLVMASVKADGSLPGCFSMRRSLAQIGTARRAGPWAILLLMLWGPQVSAGPKGQELFLARGCQYCHGERGDTPSMPLYPKIAGQNAEYAFQQMRDIRDGRRTNSMSAAMRATVSQVKDAEFQAMAEWLSRL